jgi:hypothetical protein
MYLDPDNPDKEKGNVNFDLQIIQPLKRTIKLCEQGEVREVRMDRNFLALIIRIFLYYSLIGIRDKKPVKKLPKLLNTKLNFIIATSKESETVNVQ